MRRWEWLAERVRENGWTCGAELGVKEGRTLAYLMESCPDLSMLGVDLWAPAPGYEDWDHAAHEKTARQVLHRFEARCRLLKADTVAAAVATIDGSLDFVFIDADHSTEAVLADVRAWRPKLRAGGMLCGHDAGWSSVKAALEQVCPGYRLAGHDGIWIA